MVNTVTFVMRFKKYRPKEHLWVYCIVHKAESKHKHEEQILRGGFFKNQKRTFLVVQNATF